MDSLKTPHHLSLEEGKTYFFCTCGHSARYPFCDGSHKKITTDKRSLPYVCDKAKTVVYENGHVRDV
jgi:CDGSH-type Zn-finger protein